MYNLNYLRFMLLCTAFFFLFSATVEAKPQKAYVYQLDLSANVVDFKPKQRKRLFNITLFEKKKTIGLNEILRNIRYVASNDKFVGIVLKNGSLGAGMASMKEIRDALQAFRQTGKFVYAYADVFLQSNYYLASVADKVMLNPFGAVDLKGLSAQKMFYKNTLDKLGIDVQVVRVGDYKSAVEPFSATKMSDANREQMTVALQSLWNTMLTDISAQRKVSADLLNKTADNFGGLNKAETMKDLKLVDTLLYTNRADTFIDKIAPEIYSIRRIGHEQLSKKTLRSKNNPNRIAVIYLQGSIAASTKSIHAKALAGVCERLKKDKSVKAVVVRVNSPGGDAFESEKIHHIFSELKAVKPVVVSMGDYAASGGYYISAMANKIIAEPTTITGSIGIFGMIPNMNKLYEKAGLTVDVVKTNEMGDSYGVTRAMSDVEREKMQSHLNYLYEVFVERCAKGRNKTIDEVKAIAGGRVWTGADALKIGLVDKLGGMDVALSEAAQLAGISSYKTIQYKPQSTGGGISLGNALQDYVENSIEASNWSELLKLFITDRELSNTAHIQALMPEVFVVD